MFRLATMDDIKAIAQIYEDIHDGEEAGQLTIGGYLHRVVGTILNVVG